MELGVTGPTEAFRLDINCPCNSCGKVWGLPGWRGLWKRAVSGGRVFHGIQRARMFHWLCSSVLGCTQALPLPPPPPALPLHPVSFESWYSVLQFKKIGGQVRLLWLVFCWQLCLPGL